MAAVASPVSHEAALQPSRSVQSLDGEEAGGDSIRVHVRVRPPAEREQALAGQPAVQVDTAARSLLLRGDQIRSFTFDSVLGEDSLQGEVFDSVGRGVVASCLAGYHGSVYVYGQTGAGKTHTMFGPVTSVQSMQLDERRGLICRTLDCVFAELHRRRAGGDGISCVCRCSFLEIYKEQVTDLLEPSNTGLQIREDLNRGVYVERLSEPAVGSLTEAFQVLWRGLQHRTIGATHMNERSSRSHAIFTLSVETAQTRAGVTSTRVARLSLVDLAGSERQQGLDAGIVTAPHQSTRVKEAGAINKSLSALTNVVMSLSREERSRRRSSGGGDGRRGFVHYRDSKLTFLLRDSLGGNSKTVIVANVSPSPLCYAETLSTLKFAARAKHIRCSAVRNEEFSGTLESLMCEVKTLRQQLADLGGRGFGVGDLPRSSTTELGGSDVEAGTPPAGSPRAEGEETLYSRKRIRRLEVLLAAALERERCAERRRHQLQRLAGFLEGLDFRKTQGLKKLHADYAEHIAHIETSAVSNDREGAELTEKLLSFRHLLGNLIAKNCEEGLSAGELDEEIHNSSGAVAMTAAPGGTADGPSSLHGCEVDAGTGAPTLNSSALVDEGSFLLEENRRLRLQLERHPEVHRLASENRALRRRLELLDPTGSSAPDGGSEVGSEDLSSDSDDGLSASSGQGATGGSPSRRRPRREESCAIMPPLTSEMMLSFPEGDEEGPLRTWVYVQKMAKEVEELLRAKDGLAALLQELREGRGPESRDAAADGALARGTPSPQCTVQPHIVEEVVQATQDALRLARSIASDVQKRQAKTSGERSGSTASSGETESGARQALHKVKDLHGALDLVNSAYNEAYDKFQQLREEYESRVEECQFFELQCSRLDMHCHELAERLHGVGLPVRAGIGSFSVTGLSPAQSNSMKQKRSFSLSSLRDVSFWEQRFEELSQLTGIEESDPPAPRQYPARLGGTEVLAGSSAHAAVPGVDNTVGAAQTLSTFGPSVTLGSSPPKGLASSASLSSLSGTEANQRSPHPVYWEDHPFQRAASAPQIHGVAELRLGGHAGGQLSTAASPSVTAPTQEVYMRQVQVVGSAAASGLAAVAAAAAAAAGSPGLMQAQPAAAGSGPAARPAVSSQGSPGSPSATGSTVSLYGSLSSTAMRQLSLNPQSPDSRRDLPRGHTSQPPLAVGTSRGRGDACGESGTSGAVASGARVSRAGTGRGGAATARGGRNGAGSSSGNSRNQKSTVHTASPSTSRYATSRASQSHRPQSLSLSRPRYVAAASSRGSARGYPPTAPQPR